jgi:tRNA A37 threonylcarbamoyladenosine dehydratase
VRRGAQVQVEACVDMFDKDLADELLSGKPDFVLDCIDNLETKVCILCRWVRSKPGFFFLSIRD